MKRKPLGEEADHQRIKSLLKAKNPGWKQIRLTALTMGFDVSNSLEFIAASVGVSTPTLWRWFTLYRQEGLDAVLKRHYGIGRPSGMDEAIEAYLRKGLENARWHTAQQAREELERHFERRFTYATVWSWLKKCAGVLRVPRPVHDEKGFDPGREV